MKLPILPSHSYLTASASLFWTQPAEWMSVVWGDGIALNRCCFSGECWVVHMSPLSGEKIDISLSLILWRALGCTWSHNPCLLVSFSLSVTFSLFFPSLCLKSLPYTSLFLPFHSVLCHSYTRLVSGFLSAHLLSKAAIFYIAWQSGKPGCEKETCPLKVMGLQSMVNRSGVKVTIKLTLVLHQRTQQNTYYSDCWLN